MLRITDEELKQAIDRIYAMRAEGEELDKKIRRHEIFQRWIMKVIAAILLIWILLEYAR